MVADTRALLKTVAASLLKPSWVSQPQGLARTRPERAPPRPEPVDVPDLYKQISRGTLEKGSGKLKTANLAAIVAENMRPHIKGKIAVIDRSITKMIPAV